VPIRETSFANIWIERLRNKGEVGVMIFSGIIVTLIGYASHLDVLKAFGGLLVVAMWGGSGMFRPPATAASHVARADVNARRRLSPTPKSPPLHALRQRIRARRVAAKAVAAGRPAAERDQAAARPAAVAGTTVASADLSRAAADLYSPART
jgi:hypothetical protein